MIKLNIDKDKNVLLAFSGGLDSRVLFDLCLKNKIRFCVAHCNFQLRGLAADEDEAFVINLCTENDVPFYTKRFQTKEYADSERVSIQMAARDLRYQWFDQLMIEYKFDHLAVAHHLDDSLETFIINLSRGTGLGGLVGIRENNDKVVRPLISYSRKDLEEYVAKNKLSWQEDDSNKETKYLRNKIRHNIVSELKQLNATFLENFKKTISILENNQIVLKNHYEMIFESLLLPNSGIERDIYYFDVNKILALKPLEIYLYELFNKFGFTHSKEIEKILYATAGVEIVSATYRMLKNRDELIVTKKIIGKSVENKEYFVINDLNDTFELPFKIKFSVDKKKVINTTESLDFDTIKMPLIVRKKKDGDYFYPLGMTQAKKISKYFKDNKFSTLDKENTWLLCNADGSIIYIIGHRIDDRYKTTTATINFLNIL